MNSPRAGNLAEDALTTSSRQVHLESLNPFSLWVLCASLWPSPSDGFTVVSLTEWEAIEGEKKGLQAEATDK